jgi:hypothetical protein
MLISLEGAHLFYVSIFGEVEHLRARLFSGFLGLLVYKLPGSSRQPFALGSADDR